MLVLPTLYKRTATGNIMTHTFVIDGDHYYARYGLLNGKETETEPTYCHPASQPTAALQARFEAQAAHDKKIALDYRLDINEVDTLRRSLIKPKLANKYEAWDGDCYVSAKLDGLRALGNRNGLWSRNDKPIVTCPHVEKVLQAIHKAYPHIVFDGELFSNDLKNDFNQIISIVKKTKPSADDINKSAEFISYFIYDLVDLEDKSLIFSDRQTLLRRIFKIFNLEGSCLINHRQHFCENKDDADKLMALFLEDGQEGAMHQFDTPYAEKRSNSLLKRKEFMDDEFEVVSLVEGLGQWNGAAKKVLLRLKDGQFCHAGVAGTYDANAALLNGPMPKKATVKFFGYTEDGKLRFGVAKEFFW